MVVRSEQEQALFDREVHLPGLATLLQTEHIASELDVPVGEVQLDYIRYKPRTNCLARYRLSNHTDNFVYAKTLRTNDMRKARGAQQKTPQGCEAPKEFNEGCLLYRFPQDAKLRSLWKLDSRESSWLERRFDSSAENRAFSVLAYKPERRCVLKLESASPTVLKMYNKSQFFRARDCAELAASLPGTTSPRLIGHSKRHRALQFEFVEGETLRQHIENGRGILGSAEAGQMLARLHASQCSHVKLPDSPQFAQQDLLIWLLPELEAQIESITTAALSQLQNILCTKVLIHGDYYDKQIILRANGPCLLDFDEACRGDHRLDLANFIAHIERLNPSHPEHYIDNFLESYLASLNAPLAGLCTYVALALLKLAHHPFRIGSPTWSTHTKQIVARAQAWLDREGDYRK